MSHSGRLPTSTATLGFSSGVAEFMTSSSRVMLNACSKKPHQVILLTRNQPEEIRFAQTTYVPVQRLALQSLMPSNVSSAKNLRLYSALNRVAPTTLPSGVR